MFALPWCVGINRSKGMNGLMKRKKHLPKNMVMTECKRNEPLIADIRRLIEAARSRVSAAVNAELTLLYWRVGKRIREDILKEKRAEYGGEIVVSLSRQLAPLYGDGFGSRNLFRMISFSEHFPDERIVSTLSAQLSWSHFLVSFGMKTN